MRLAVDSAKRVLSVLRIVVASSSPRRAGSAILYASATRSLYAQVRGSTWNPFSTGLFRFTCKRPRLSNATCLHRSRFSVIELLQSKIETRSPIRDLALDAGSVHSYSNWLSTSASRLLFGKVCATVPVAGFAHTHTHTIRTGIRGTHIDVAPHAASTVDMNCY